MQFIDFESLSAAAEEASYIIWNDVGQMERWIRGRYVARTGENVPMAEITKGLDVVYSTRSI